MMERPSITMAIQANWHRADVVAEIHKRGTTLAKLAAENNRSDAALRMALSEPRKPSNEIIASFLGKSLHEIWPAWFDAMGRRHPRKPVHAVRLLSSQKRNRKLTQRSRA